MKEKKRVRALKLQLAFEESERQTDAWLAQQREARARVDEDDRVQALLRLRQAGLSPQEALARVEAERRPARAARADLSGLRRVAHARPPRAGPGGGSTGRVR